MEIAGLCPSPNVPVAWRSRARASRPCEAARPEALAKAFSDTLHTLVTSLTRDVSQYRHPLRPVSRLHPCHPPMRDDQAWFRDVRRLLSLPFQT
jgi:hypothetical protein